MCCINTLTVSQTAQISTLPRAQYKPLPSPSHSMSPRQIHFLLLTSAVLVITSRQYLTALRLQHTHTPKTNPTSILKHCYILTLNASLKPRTLSPGLNCYPFLPERFNEQQFALVAPIAQQQLLYPEKQTMASDLTNNNSVSLPRPRFPVGARCDETSEPPPVLY